MTETNNSGRLLEKDGAGDKGAQAKQMSLTRFILISLWDAAQNKLGGKFKTC